MTDQNEKGNAAQGAVDTALIGNGGDAPTDQELSRAEGEGMAGAEDQGPDQERRDASVLGQTERTVAATVMPRYLCHKHVWALKIASVDGDVITPEDAGFLPITVSADYVSKHNPQPGGYYVVYEDGYKSYSPAKPFEEGYTVVSGNVPTEGSLEAKHTALVDKVVHAAEACGISLWDDAHGLMDSIHLYIEGLQSKLEELAPLANARLASTDAHEEPRPPEADGVYDNVLTGVREVWSGGKLLLTVAKDHLEDLAIHALPLKYRGAWGTYPDVPRPTQGALGVFNQREKQP